MPDPLPASPQSVVDLHLHTFYSDGRSSPEELLRAAHQRGLKIIAITDHDNTRGSRQARPLARELGLELIPAIEFTCCWDVQVDGYLERQDVDLLGYGMDLDSPALQAMESASLFDIYQRIDSCARRLTSRGYPISMHEVFLENPRYVGILQLGQVLLRKGFCPDLRTAIDWIDPYWNETVSAYSIRQMVATIHAAGGVAVLAHPTAYHFQQGLMGEEHFAAAQEIGLDGVEIFHFRLDAVAREHFLAIARNLHLLVTGGSDEHAWPEGFQHLGSERIGEEIVEALRARWQSRP